jgi:folate-binding protein YgfZ
MGETLWQQLRIEQGRPMAGAELTEDYNPLEAGLWAAVSFDKGCYIGQETIARLNTYQGVKQQLWGLTLSAAAEPGSPITHGGAKVGQLTSVVETPTGLAGAGLYPHQSRGGWALRNDWRHHCPGGRHPLCFPRLPGCLRGDIRGPQVSNILEWESPVPLG